MAVNSKLHHLSYNNLTNNKKDKISIEIPTYRYQELCRLYLAKGIKTTTNDPDLQDFINHEIRNMKR